MTVLYKLSEDLKSEKERVRLRDKQLDELVKMVRQLEKKICKELQNEEKKKYKKSDNPL